MSTTDKRCGTCRYFEDNPDDVCFCLKTIPTCLPFWARNCLADEYAYVKTGDGTDCDAWEHRP